MIDWIHIKNYKSLQDTGRVDIRPLTLLMGPNSSGKSSILQPLLVMRQTVDSRDVERPIILDGSYANLGPFDGFIYKHEKRSLSISFQISASRSFLPPSVRKAANLEATRKHQRSSTMVAECRIGAAEQMRVYIEEARFSIVDRSGITIELAKTRGPHGKVTALVQLADKTGKYALSRDGRFYDLMPATEINPLSVFGRRGSSEVRWGLFDATRRASQATKAILEDAFSKVFYIGPLREEPWPIYVGSGERPQDVGPRGEDAMQVLFFSKIENRLAEVRRQATRWMEEFEIGTEFNVKRMEGAYFYLAMKDAHTSTKVRLADVGFGASQLLPLIVEGYYAPSNSLIIAEQPEIHLHPRAQAILADLLIDIAGRRGRRLVVETHSEHLLYRIQRRIAEGMIDSRNVAVYYCRPTAEGTEVKRIALTNLGQFDPDGLPDDFFTEGYQELKAFSEAMARKEKET